MEAKVACQTTIWGSYLPSLEEVLDIIMCAGYQGVEFAQRPDMLGRPNLKIEELLALLSYRNLELVSLAGGTLRERMDFCGDFRPIYLYTEEWDEYAPRAMSGSNPFTLALHPHYHKKLQHLNEAKALLELHKELKWLPDTAHLVIGGDDPVKAIGLAPDRLIAVHLKDWTPTYGTSYYRYSRGFTELGQGIVPLNEILKQLELIDYSGWLIVEQDGTRTDPQTSVLESAHWLFDKGFLKTKPKRSNHIRIKRPVNYRGSISAEADSRFIRDIMGSSTQEIPKCYYKILTAFQKLVPCRLATLWAYDSVHDVITLLAADPEEPTVWNRCQSLDAKGTLSQVAVDRQAVTYFDLLAPHPAKDYHRSGARFGYQALIDLLGLRHMISIPISNPSNTNSVRLILNIFPDEVPLQITNHDLFLFGMDIARAMDFALDEKCSSVAAEANFYAGQSTNSKIFLEHIAHQIKKALNCEGVTVFLANDRGDRLEVAGTTGISWEGSPSYEKHYYSKGEGCTGTVWQKNEAILTRDVREISMWQGKSTEFVADNERHACLFSPFASSKRLFGVVRCRNKAKDELGRVHMFSDHELALLDAINQAAVPHLEVLLSNERRIKAQMRLYHEVRQALAAVRGAVDLVNTELINHNVNPARLFRHDYIGDALSWSVLIQRLLDNTNISGIETEDICLQLTPCRLGSDVVAPAVTQMRPLLEARGFSMRSIRYTLFDDIPRLWIDKNYFQQVIFNVLSNAIKHAFADPSLFRVSINGEKRRDEFLITILDQGPGIVENIGQAIFEEGVRGPDALNSDVAGQGIGLFIARRLVEAHGGKIFVTHFYRPTEVTISLPISLASQPPRVRTRRKE